MKIIYTTESLTDIDGASIFLAGPSPRKESDGSWRPEAMRILETYGFKGTVLNPEQRNGPMSIDFTKHGYPADWEMEAIKAATSLVFWIPRTDTLPGFTTNVEFGYYVRNSNVFYGRPEGAKHTRYLDWLWKKHQSSLVYNNLYFLLKTVVESLDWKVNNHQFDEGYREFSIEELDDINFDYGTIPDTCDVEKYLISKGYLIKDGYGWRDKDKKETPQESKALNYLFHEWDYCFGFNPPT